jgi:drug/metabolite transporter (DMT)-like permease
MRSARLWAVLAGLFFAADLILWHHAIENVGAGLSTVLGNTQVVLVGLVAWVLLSERPSNRALVSIPVVMVGVVLISGAIGGNAYGEHPGLGVLYGVLTALMYTGFLLTLRHGNQDTWRPAGPLCDATAVSALACLAAGFVLGDLDLTPGWAATAWLVTLALTSQVLGWLLISLSLPRLPAVLTSILLTLQPVMTVVLGMVLLDETPSALQLLGAAAILSGLILVTLGRREQRIEAPVLEAG